MICIEKYLDRPTEDYLVAVVKEAERSMQHGIMSSLEEVNKGTAASINTKHQQGLREMPMHEQLWRQQEELLYFDQPRAVGWLHTAHLQYRKESCLCAVQEQALGTGYFRARVWGNGSSGLCLLC